MIFQICRFIQSWDNPKAESSSFPRDLVHYWFSKGKKRYAVGIEENLCKLASTIRFELLCLLYIALNSNASLCVFSVWTQFHVHFRGGQICFGIWHRQPFDSCKMGKPRGIRAGRKLHKIRKIHRWHDYDWKQAHLPGRFKSDPLGGASHAKGIVLEKVYASILVLCDLRLEFTC
jgi:hypothetical protein